MNFIQKDSLLHIKTEFSDVVTDIKIKSEVSSLLFDRIYFFLAIRYEYL